MFPAYIYLAGCRIMAFGQLALYFEKKTSRIGLKINTKSRFSINLTSHHTFPIFIRRQL